MRNLATKVRHKVKRLHTTDRRRGYISPTGCDERCPFFQDRFVLMGEAPVVDDLYAICEDKLGEADCDYKTELVKDRLYVCSRYLKESHQGFEDAPPDDDFNTNDQWVDVTYEYIRKFEHKTANIGIELYMGGEAIEQVSTYDLQLSDAYSGSTWAIINENLIKSTSNGSHAVMLYEHPDGREISDFSFDFEFYVPSGFWDGDWIGAVFRYNKSDNSHYRIRMDGGDAGHDTTIQRIVPGQSTQTLYHTNAVGWYHGATQRLRVESISDSQFRVKYWVNGALKFDTTITDANPLTEGTFGLYVHSQQEAHFTNISGEVSAVLTMEDDERLGQGTSLQLQLDGNLSKTMNDYFADIIYDVHQGSKWSEYPIDKVKYSIIDDNILEDIYFTDTGTKQTYNPNAKVAIADYDYDKLQTRTFSMSILGTETDPKTHTEHFVKDANITRVYIDPTQQKFQDRISLLVNKNEFHYVPNVIETEYDIKLDQHVPVNGDVHFTYEPNFMNMGFFIGPSVDTHLKKFKIRNNILGWHPDIKVGEE